MINFDSLTLKAFLEENKDFLVGARIQKIKQFSRAEVMLQLHKSGETRKLYININPSCFHLCFMSEENEKKRALVAPKSALMFCMLLRKYMDGVKITDVQVPKYERIFEIYFDYYVSEEEKNRYCLAVELMGKYSNIILYNYDTNVIAGCCHNVSAQKSKERELSGLLPYSYPKKQRKKDLLKTSFEEFQAVLKENKNLSEEFYYLTNVIVENAFGLSENEHELYEKLRNLVSLSSVSPSVSNDFEQFSLLDIENAKKYDSTNEMIDDYFTYQQSEKAANTTKIKLLSHINQQIEKFEELKEKQEKLAFETGTIEENKEKADLIMANLYQLKDGEKALRAVDFNGREVVISLDENKSGSENAEHYYTLYKKSKSASEKSKELLEETLKSLKYWEEKRQEAEETEDAKLLETLSKELLPQQTKQNNQKKSDKNLEMVEFLGFKIYVGKNDRQNDYLLSKISSPEDLWFHPLNGAGAHVLIKKNKNGETVPDEVILKAARLTKQYSSSKNSTKVPIIYTNRKYVKKANNKIAFVTYKYESEIMV
ncbi:DUF814 domain-containing protein [bacterium]|nr:DUF814 domain-containing protein [bacterium]